MDSFNYTTQEGERIDLLAARFYGGSYGIALISDANPAVPLDAVFPMGTILAIPIIEEQAQNNDHLPPWKR